MDDSDQRSIEVAMWLLVFVQIIGNVDAPGRGPRKLPPPRAFVPIIVGFTLLEMLADAGLSKAAKGLAWVTVAAAATLGPFGTRFVNFLNTVASNFAIQQSTPAVTPSTTPGGTP